MKSVYRLPVHLEVYPLLNRRRFIFHVESELFPFTAGLLDGPLSAVAPGPHRDRVRQQCYRA